MSLFDIPAGKRKKVKFNPRPPMPPTTWKRTNHFPDLSGAKAISFDVETKDKDLMTYGPGWGRGVGHIIGVAIGTDDGYTNYYPMRHEDEGHDNYEPQHVIDYMKEQLGRSSQRKVGHNLIYDVGWLTHEGVTIRGKLWDTMIASKVLDFGSRQHSLEAQAKLYGFEGKDSSDLYDWLWDYYGQKKVASSDRGLRELAATNFYRCPPRLIGSYAESDVRIPLQVAKEQYKALKKAKLATVFDVECRLLPVLVAMRMKGVSVDLRAATKAHDEITITADGLQKEIDSLAGFTGVETGSSICMEKVFKNLKISVAKTAKGKVSLAADNLKLIRHPIGKHIIDLAELKKYRSTFIESYIMNSNINGKVYGEFNQMGAITGRFSSSNPNLQNLPSKNDLAKCIRRIFIPDEGHPFWRKYDYASIENRVLAEYAVGRAGADLRQQYIDNPMTDYHRWCQELVAPVAGWDISTKELLAKWRKPVKTINFGITYGMGEELLAQRLGISLADARKVLSAYHGALPFVKDTMDYLSDRADRLGYSETILGRKVKFDMWEPSEWSANPLPPLVRGRALAAYGFNIRKAGLYKATNYTIQGSAADLMKVAMVECWEQGVFDQTGVPRMTVHDELDFSDEGGNDAAFLEMAHIMETALPFKVPVIVDGEVGPNWQDLTDIPRVT